jgi:hypothetical protein
VTAEPRGTNLGKFGSIAQYGALSAAKTTDQYRIIIVGDDDDAQLTVITAKSLSSRPSQRRHNVDR